jgi:hypothetical protein
MRSALMCLGVVLSALLGGCAGLHSVPPEGYTGALPQTMRVERIVFDQNGCVYPSRLDQRAWAQLNQQEQRLPPAAGQRPFPAPVDRPRGDFAYTICGQKRGPYLGYRETEARDAAAARINQALSATPGAMLVIQVAGYNESFATASIDMLLQRQRIAAIHPEGAYVFVEAYWDSLYRGTFSQILPVTYWFKAATYSNHAGIAGLRPILNRIQLGHDLMFVAKSRGSAVVLAALVDPLYEAAAWNTVSGTSRPPIEDFQRARFGRIGIALVAPAIGNGHLNPVTLGGDIDRRSSGATPVRADTLAALGVSLASTVNHCDPATDKQIGLASRLNDTRLNNSYSYSCTVERQIEAHDPASGTSRSSHSRFGFRRSSHATATYLHDLETMHCLYAASGIVPDAPGLNCGQRALVAEEGCPERRPRCEPDLR